MSFGFSSIKNEAKSFHQPSSNNHVYEIESPLVAELGATRKQVGFSHPLEASELNFQKNNESMEMLMLRNTQGLHAPLRLAMELRSVDKVGRLPFLQSSDALRDAILGRDEDIGFEDILNIPEFSEKMGQPHAVVEKSMGIL